MLIVIIAINIIITIMIMKSCMMNYINKDTMTMIIIMVMVKKIQFMQMENILKILDVQVIIVLILEEIIQDKMDQIVIITIVMQSSGIANLCVLKNIVLLEFVIKKKEKDLWIQQKIDVKVFLI